MRYMNALLWCIVCVGDDEKVVECVGMFRSVCNERLLCYAAGCVCIEVLWHFLLLMVFV